MDWPIAIAIAVPSVCLAAVSIVLVLRIPKRDAPFVRETVENCLRFFKFGREARQISMKEIDDERQAKQLQEEMKATLAKEKAAADDWAEEQRKDVVEVGVNG